MDIKSYGHKEEDSPEVLEFAKYMPEPHYKKIVMFQRFYKPP